MKCTVLSVELILIGDRASACFSDWVAYHNLSYSVCLSQTGQLLFLTTLRMSHYISLSPVLPIAQICHAYYRPGNALGTRD